MDMNPWLSCHGTTLIQTPALDGMAVMKTWKQLRADGKLTAEAAAFAGSEQPAEEFYDLLKDPHDVGNLVGATHDERANVPRATLAAPGHVG